MYALLGLTCLQNGKNLSLLGYVMISRAPVIIGRARFTCYVK